MLTRYERVILRRCLAASLRIVVLLGWLGLTIGAAQLSRQDLSDPGGRVLVRALSALFSWLEIVLIVAVPLGILRTLVRLRAERILESAFGQGLPAAAIGRVIGILMLLLVLLHLVLVDLAERFQTSQPRKGILIVRTDDGKTVVAWQGKSDATLSDVALISDADTSVDRFASARRLGNTIRLEGEDGSARFVRTVTRMTDPLTPVGLRSAIASASVRPLLMTLMRIGLGVALVLAAAALPLLGRGRRLPWAYGWFLLLVPGLSLPFLAAAILLWSRSGPSVPIALGLLASIPVTAALLYLVFRARGLRD